MVAVSKIAPYEGFTLKGLIAKGILDGLTLSQLTSALTKSFPRKFAKAATIKKIPKLVSKALRALHRGKLKYDQITTTHVPPPKELITIKGVEFNPPKAFLKKDKAEKKSKTTKTKSKTKGKTSGRVSVSDDGDVVEVE